ncbi:MAG TPA: hypothetical protein VK084_10080 [Chitinophagaceae bacterium]|nr:hypothetical protein [Chitinophagaceae bacterium]
MAIHKKLEEYISALKDINISEERKTLLFPLVNYIIQKQALLEPISLHFICTHNSRRSHFAQVWTQTFSYYFDIKDLYCYSGGTEATSVYPKVITTLLKAGFEAIALSEKSNPVWSIIGERNKPPIIGFSKRWNHPFNPESHFAAILTCSRADKECPHINGAEQRIVLPFEDPKTHDNSPNQDEKYAMTCRQIAGELFFVFEQLYLKKVQLN